MWNVLIIHLCCTMSKNNRSVYLYVREFSVAQFVGWTLLPASTTAWVTLIYPGTCLMDILIVFHQALVVPWRCHLCLANSRRTSEQRSVWCVSHFDQTTFLLFLRSFFPETVSHFCLECFTHSVFYFACFVAVKSSCLLARELSNLCHRNEVNVNKNNSWCSHRH